MARRNKAGDGKPQYRTTCVIYTGKDGQTRLPIGSTVEFDDEPTGVFVGRVELVPGDEEVDAGAPPPPPAS